MCSLDLARGPVPTCGSLGLAIPTPMAPSVQLELPPPLPAPWPCPWSWSPPLPAPCPCPGSWTQCWSAQAFPLHLPCPRSHFGFLSDLCSMSHSPRRRVSRGRGSGGPSGHSWESIVPSGPLVSGARTMLQALCLSSPTTSPCTTLKRQPISWKAMKRPRTSRVDILSV